MQLNVRPSPIAGRWYVGQPKALAKSIDNYLDNAKIPELNGEVIAVIAPTPDISTQAGWQVTPSQRFVDRRRALSPLSRPCTSIIRNL